MTFSITEMQKISLAMYEICYVSGEISSQLQGMTNLSNPCSITLSKRGAPDQATWQQTRNVTSDGTEASSVPFF